MYLIGCHHYAITTAITSLLLLTQENMLNTKKKVDRNTSLFFLNVMIVSGIQTMKCCVHTEITSYF